MKKIKKSPSRVRYENSHPTVSARLPKEKYEKLLSILKTTNTTLSQQFSHVIDEFEIKIKPIEEARQEAFQEGFTQAWKKALERYAVKYPCAKCGKEIIVGSEIEKSAIRKFMTESGWYHGDCTKA